MLCEQFYIISGLECISKIPGYDPSYNLIYFNSWSTYSEWAWLAFFEKEGKYYEMSDGYSTMLGDLDGAIWVLDEINQYEALDIMIEFNQVCEDIDKIEM